MTSAFDNLSGPGKPLKPEPPDAVEFAGLRRSANRYIVFQLLPHTLGLGPEVWRVMAKCHDIRNRGEYEGDLEVAERLVTDLIDACSAVARRLDRLVEL
ncbi:MAG TPA: hypothetical protein PKB08_12780 [Burkholderiaceae bacterium]|nr:hypothetical protein [Burkholderiaceae bacterium]HMN65872.1 hypothetical protein [Burkholderiaceae bacterium]